MANFTYADLLQGKNPNISSDATEAFPPPPPGYISLYNFANGAGRPGYNGPATPGDYAKHLYGGGEIVDSPTYGPLFKLPPGRQEGQYVNQPTAYDNNTNEFADFAKASALAFGGGYALSTLAPASSAGMASIDAAESGGTLATNAAGTGVTPYYGNAVDPLAWTGADAGNPGAPGSFADTSGYGYGPNGTMTAAQWMAAPGPGGAPSSLPGGAPSGMPGSMQLPPGVSQLLQSGMALPDILKAISSGVGIASGINSMTKDPAVDPNQINDLWQAGRDTYNRSLVPNTALTGGAADVLQAGKDTYGRSLIPNADLKAKSDAAFNVGMDTYNRSLVPNADLKAKSDAAFNVGMDTYGRSLVPNSDLKAKTDAIYQAGQNTYNTALDPQGELYKRNQQILQDQVRAAQAARGTAMSPYGAGIENKAMSDFNIDWQNQQLQRQIAGEQAFAASATPAANYANYEMQRQGQGANAAIAGTQPAINFNAQEIQRQGQGANAAIAGTQPAMAYTNLEQQRQQQGITDYLASFAPTLSANAQELQRQQQGMQGYTGAGQVAANAGIANNAQAFLQNQVGLNNVTTGIGQVGDWLKNLWGGGSSQGYNGSPTQAAANNFDMSWFTNPTTQPANQPSLNAATPYYAPNTYNATFDANTGTWG